jgi:hypothetical protein
MSKIDDNKSYQKHKKKPLVKALVGYYRKMMVTSTIPEIWHDFIKNSTKTTDTAILLSQFPKWGITETIDPELRGEELFEAILDSKMIRMVELADVKARDSKKAWPDAFQFILSDQGITPSASQISAISRGSILVEADMYVQETGTLKYQINRHYNSCRLQAPAEWILENCSPKHSDREVCLNFTNGVKRGFIPKEVTGFEYRAALANRVRILDNVAWDPKGLCGRINDILPITSQVKSHGEFVTTVNMHSGEPDPIMSDADVIARNVKFSGVKHSRNRPLEGQILFPFVPGRSLNSMLNESLAYDMCFDPNYEEEDRNDMILQLSRTLRKAYTEIVEIREYEAMVAALK